MAFNNHQAEKGDSHPSLYLLYMNLAETHHEPASADLGRHKPNQSKSYDWLIQNYGHAHPWVPALAPSIPTSVIGHTEKDHYTGHRGKVRRDEENIRRKGKQGGL